MGTFKEAEARIQKDIYVCQRTGKKIRLPINKFLTGKFSVRKGMSKYLRPMRKKSKK
ncbi:MAG: hypothetical protein ACLFPL_05325 [Candidatus Nanoarchaeia archaeon]